MIRGEKMARYNFDFGKLDESKNIEYAPIPLVVNDENIWTNVPETYIGCGYYPVRYTEMPEKEDFYYIPYYELENNEIVQKWEEHELPEPDATDGYELLDIITEGVKA